MAANNAEALSSIGQHFAKEYYNRLVTRPAKYMQELYSPNAHLTILSGQSESQKDSRRAEGIEEIIALLEQMSFTNLVPPGVKLSTIDAQPSPQFNTVLVLTTGKIGEREFVQTFIVEAQMQSGLWKCCARHDMLRFLDNGALNGFGSGSSTKPARASSPSLPAETPAHVDQPVPATQPATSSAAETSPSLTNGDVPAAASEAKPSEPAAPSPAVAEAVPEPVAEPKPEPEQEQEQEQPVEAAADAAAPPSADTAQKADAPKAERKPKAKKPAAKRDAAKGSPKVDNNKTAKKPVSPPKDEGPKSWAQIAQAKDQAAGEVTEVVASGKAPADDVPNGRPASNGKPASKAPPAAAAAEADTKQVESPAEGERRKPARARDMPQPDPEDLDKYVFVRNVPKGATEDEIRAAFSQFGEVVDVEIHRNKRYCFVQFPNTDCTRAAFAASGRNAPLSRRVTIGDDVLLVEERKPAIGKKAAESDGDSPAGFRTRGGSFRGRGRGARGTDGVFRGRGSPRGARRGGERGGRSTEPSGQ